MNAELLKIIQLNCVTHIVPQEVFMVGRLGFEPRPHRLKGEYANSVKHYRPINLVGRERFELSSIGLKVRCFAS